MWSLLTTAVVFAHLSIAAPTAAAPAIEKRAAPSVKLDYANVVGSSALGVDSFKGIPFAQPPVGKLRLKPPQPIMGDLGTVKATGIPRACPQMYLKSDDISEDILGRFINTPFFQTITNAGEDCLTLNVQRPASATPDSKLPVLFWIFGGAFELGSTQLYDGTSLILRSMAQKRDIIVVAVNYRVGGFGFMPGSDIQKDGSANLGLLDQRLGLKWVADNIAKFGGDPEKVTIWGESAGAISAFDQMAMYDGDHTYKGKPLFRAAIMNSGSVVPADPVDCPKGEVVYNKVVEEAGCANAADKLDCLRSRDYTTFLNAANSVPPFLSYSSVALSYLPRPDGKVLTASPDVLGRSGRIAKVPFIIGDQEDEGTIFALTQSNITTTDQVVDYFHTYFFHGATKEQLKELVATYPDDPSAGSPFRTGILNQLYPQYKRLAAMLGDLVFTLSRRVFLNIANEKFPDVPSWSYLATYNHGIPVVGTFHASDILTSFGYTPGIPSTSIQNYYLSFVNTMDPNKGTPFGFPKWPRWSEGKKLMNFQLLGNTLLSDDFRAKSAQFMADHIDVLHV
ncbi:lipase 4 [Nannizzia gypsea CBS 118893]|uniref:Carboxylic ester hydrolase n=1 Tax=Arthroderma gypseum (strain ATCC MYA-4604 / CBS 118893) TaxID=535722 RepID=E4UVE6_ARTGP|nr:lipase 4 [Nannizzia gypsea CBS 118893]EFR02273.1 lipase 4 [Nannizzia gypsea CBS 118893]